MKYDTLFQCESIVEDMEDHLTSLFAKDPEPADIKDQVNVWVRNKSLSLFFSSICRFAMNDPNTAKRKKKRRKSFEGIWADQYLWAGLTADQPFFIID